MNTCAVIQERDFRSLKRLLKGHTTLISVGIIRKDFECFECYEKNIILFLEVPFYLSQKFFLAVLSQPIH